MIVSDTTVLVDAMATEHPLRDPCRALRDAVATGRLRGTTTIDVVQEFAHVRARRRTRADAEATASAWIELLSPLLEVGEADLPRGLRLFGDHRHWARSTPCWRPRRSPRAQRPSSRPIVLSVWSTASPMWCPIATAGLLA